MDYIVPLCGSRRIFVVRMLFACLLIVVNARLLLRFVLRMLAMMLL